MNEKDPEVQWSYDKANDHQYDRSSRIYGLAAKLTRYNMPEEVRDIGREISRHAGSLTDAAIAGQFRDREPFKVDDLNDEIRALRTQNQKLRDVVEKVAPILEAARPLVLTHLQLQDALKLPRI